MEQTDVMEQTQPVGPPVMPESRWDPEKASKRKVRVLKVPHGEDPMEKKTVFEFGGFVYICYAVKTRGRYMIRCLGLADVERPREKEQTPFESGKLLDEATKELDADAMGDAIKEAIDDETVQQVIKEVTGDGRSRGPDETPNP